MTGTAKIFRIILPVSDIDQATEYYQKLLGTEGERVSKERHYFNCGEVILTCYDASADGDHMTFRPNPGHIYFSVDNIEAWFKRANTLSHERIDEVIAKRPWGERSFYLNDIFGNQLCFVESNTEFKGLTAD